MQKVEMIRLNILEIDKVFSFDPAHRVRVQRNSVCVVK